MLHKSYEGNFLSMIEELGDSVATTTFICFINNTALLIALALFYDFLVLRQAEQKASLNQITIGVIL